MTRHFLEITDLTVDELSEVLDRSTLAPPLVLERQGVALFFEKPSARTRHSMEIATVQLGGHPVYVQPAEVGIDVRETAEDLARVFMGYHAILAARTFSHSVLERMASVSRVPVVNLLSDESHPIQVLADLLTIRQEFGRLDGLKMAYIGDANNMARSLALGCRMVGAELVVAHPDGYGFNESARKFLEDHNAVPVCMDDPRAAAAGAEVVYTDAWYSMGQEDEAVIRRAAFSRFQVDDAVMSCADPDAIFLHCLPAHRGDEASDSVLDGHQSRIFPQAHNRLHSARGLLWFLAEQVR